MAKSGREPQVSNKCVRSSGGTLSRRTAHLTSTPRTSPLEVSYSPTSLSNAISRSVTPVGSCPKPKCVSSCSCARERASTRLLADDLQRGSAGQHDDQIPEQCVHVLVHRCTWYPRVCMRCQICFFPSFCRVGGQPQTRMNANLKLQ